MTQDERNLLNDLASKIAQTPAPPKDPEAEEFIRTRIGSRPDALYLMTQTVLVQNIALQNAQQQIQDLQARAGQPAPAGSGSFLGGSPRPQAYGAGGGPQYTPQYAQPSPQAPQPAPSGMFGGGGGGSSFLRGAAQTAAGVAAGTLAAEAIGSMFSHHGGFGGSGLMGGAPVEETVVNNYYDNPPDDLRVDDRAGQDSFADPADLANTQYDDSATDDSFDDGGGFEDGGGNDDGF